MAGHAFPRTHRSYDPSGARDDGESVIDVDDLAALLDADWEVHVPGREPYTVRDVGRRAPHWIAPSAPLVGKGKRFWSVRWRSTGGLLAEVGVPCLVAPDDPGRLWLDWDAGHDLHVSAWDRARAIDAAVEQRRGGIDAVIGRITAPRRIRLDPAAEREVEARLAAEAAASPQAQTEAPLLHRAVNPSAGPPDPGEQARLAEHVRAAAHLHLVGREVPATVAAISPTGRRLCGTPEYEIQLDVDDAGGVRRVVHREVMGDAFAGRMAAGSRTLVCVDPADPDRLALERPEALASRLSRGLPALAEYGQRVERITLHGRRAEAVIVSAEATGRQLHGLPE